MKTNIKKTNLRLSADEKEHFDKRIQPLEKFLARYEKGEAILNVELGRTTRHHKSGDIFKAELTLVIGRESLRAVSERDDIKTAIDEAKKEMSGELRNRKAKKITLRKKGGVSIKSMLIKGM